MIHVVKLVRVTARNKSSLHEIPTIKIYRYIHRNIIYLFPGKHGESMRICFSVISHFLSFTVLKQKK